MDFALSFGVAFVVCIVLYKLSDCFSPAWHPPSYVTEKPERRILWNTTLVAVWPGLVVPWWAIAGGLEFYAKYGLNLVGPPNSSLYISLGLALGYMTFDTVMMCLFPTELRKALKPALYKQMMYHHILSIIIWPYAFYAERAVIAIAYFLVTESSNLFLNTRWLMSEKGVTGAPLILINVLVFIVYTIVRILPIPFFLWALTSADWQQFSIVQRLLSTFLLVPLALNVFWYSLLIKGGVAMWRKLKGTKSHA